MVVTGAFDNIDDLQRALYDLIEQLPDRVYLKNQKREFIYANRATLKAAKYSSLNDLKGKTDDDLFTESHIRRAKQDDELIINEGADKNFENKLELETWKDGRLKWVSTTKQAVVENGKTVYIFGITREVAVEGADPILQRLVSGQSCVPIWDAGIYYQNLQTKKVWFDAQFTKNFPGNGLKARFRHIHPDDRRPVAQFLHDAVRSKDVFNCTIEFRTEMAPGEYKWIRGHGIVYGAPGERSLIVAHEDISEEKVRHAIAAKILENFPGYVFVKDTQRRFRFMNRPLLERLRKSLADVLNKTDLEIGLPQADVEVYAKHDLAVLGGTIPGPLLSEGEALTLPGGEKKRLFTIKIPLPAEVFDPCTIGKGARHILGISWDITEYWRKFQDANQVWRSILKFSPDAIYCKDANGVYVDANEVFGDLVGHKPENIVNKRAREVFVGQDELVKEIELEDRDILEQRLPMIQKVRWLRRLDGKLRIGISIKLPVMNETGKVCRILGINRDITHVHAHEAFGSKGVSGLSQVPEPKKKWITVLFCDIRGVARIAKELESHPDVLVDFVDSFFRVVVDIAVKRKGVVEKLIGDGAMVLFGVLDEDENKERSAFQAAEFALELQESFKTVADTWKNSHEDVVPISIDFRLGIGINSGETVVGFIRSGWPGQFSVFGVTVNIAKDLEFHAARRTLPDILVSPPVYQRIRGKCKLEAVQLIKLRGGGTAKAYGLLSKNSLSSKNTRRKRQ